jgi:hypothetical protein
MHEFMGDSTPVQFLGERQEPNPLQWFRFENWGKGAGSRLFYNEEPNPMWWRHQGHLDNKEECLYSFTHGDEN